MPYYQLMHAENDIRKAISALAFIYEDIKPELDKLEEIAVEIYNLIECLKEL